MRKLFLYFTILSMLSASIAYAQTQSGVVKTRGRMENGKLVPGTPLSGATVQEMHKVTAYDYLFLANCYEGMNEFDKALEYAEKSLAIYKKTIGEGNKETQAAKATIEEIKEKRRESGVRYSGQKQKNSK